MSYKIPEVPSPRAYIEELADFWEVLAIKDQPISQINVVKAIEMGSDEMLIDGVDSSEDESNMILDDALMEINTRSTYFGSYPFDISDYSIRLNTSKPQACTYIFLLLVTRLNMTQYKIQKNIDGTHLFEKLCAQVAKEYFGRSTESLVFGTSTTGSFEEKVNQLISRTGIGRRFANPNNNTPTAKDAGVDLIIWKEFSDREEGKLIGFAQCKTGTSWRESYKQLTPVSFCENWLLESPIVTPISIIFISDTLNRAKNFKSDQRGFLFFNRFRIMEYLPESLPSGLQDEINEWTRNAIEVVLKG